MFQRVFIFTISILSAIVAFAQGTGTVKGTLTDSTGKTVELVVSVVVEESQRYHTESKADGTYSLQVPADKEITLVFSSLNISKPERRKVTVPAGQTLLINQVVSIKENNLTTAVINGEKNPIQGPSEIEIKVVDQLPSLNDGIEAYLLGNGASSHSELSSTYSVRGGNFDENLVYVNDFEVYRPFLIRSGQQEGLSFVNTSMVSNVKFSTGGFQAKYGDKMSSVLDVTYKRPVKFAGSIYGSLLGFGGHLEGCDKKQRFTFVLGVRQKLSQYILKSLDEKGQYSPNFVDVQGFFTYRIKEKWAIEYLVNYSRNNFIFRPVNRETTFGLLTDVKKFTVYFDGQEIDKYQTLMNGLSLIYTPTSNVTLKLLGSQYHSSEVEAYDILGEYYLSQVESDLGKDNFGDVLYSLGIGGLQNWARNTLKSDIYYAGHRGTWAKEIKGVNYNLQWGLDYKREVIEDKISEWDRTDSAGYSIPYSYAIDYNNVDSLGNPIPYNKLQVGLNSVLKSQVNLKSNRFSGFVQNSWKFGANNRINATLGVRFQYWDVNKEFIATPRFQLSIKPKNRDDLIITAAAGTYYQPPFYREMRGFDGTINTSLRSQKSAHLVVGVNYAFTAWQRKFSFVTEAYGKYLWDLVPYEFDNVLIRYFGTNSSKGYAAGVDFRLNGELAEGLESWVSLGLMHTEENLSNDKKVSYFDSTGTEVANNTANASRIVDSTTTYPGYIVRPTDQLVNFAMFFQDYIPKFKFIKVHLTMVFATGLPFGPPDHERYKDVFRIPAYKRVDIGFSGQLWNPNWAKKQNKFNQGIKSAWLSLEVFNIFGITNTVSYLWVKDVNNISYAIPNYLTSRRVNVKVAINF